MPEKHIVVLGGGFAGLNFVLHCRHPGARITVVDQNNHHLFQPLLYQVATAGLSMPDIAEPLRSLFSNRPDIDTIMGKVEKIDLGKRQVSLADATTIEYDYLVVALGAITGYFDHPEWENYAQGLKSMRDAMVIRRQVLTAFERAEQETDDLKRQKLMNLVVVGGGPTGVELAGALAELTKRVFEKDFRRLDPQKARIILIHPYDSILNTFPDPLPAKALASLKKLGVEVWLGSRVKDIGKQQVLIQTKTPEGVQEFTFEAETIVWTAGVIANPIVQSLETRKDKKGRIAVEPDCSLVDHPEVFAIGDVVSLTDPKGVEVPGLAAAAMQMGTYLADVMKSRLDNRPVRRPFIYKDKGSMATIGRSSAVAVLGKWKLSGFIAWILWLTIHLLLLIGFRDKITVLVQWFFSYIRYNNGARIIVDLGRRSEE